MNSRKKKTIRKLKSGKNRNVFKNSNFKKAGKTALNFIRHFTEESPKIVWRIASFDSSATEIRKSIVLPLSEIIYRMKDASLSEDEKRLNMFKFILYWPELFLKLQGFVRKSAITAGVSALTKSPRFYRKNKNGDFDQIKKELQTLVLLRLWKNLKKDSVKESTHFLNRLKKALSASLDFSEQPQLKGVLQTVIQELGFDELLKALSTQPQNESKNKKKL